MPVLPTEKGTSLLCCSKRPMSYLQPDVKWVTSDVANRGILAGSTVVTDGLSAAQKAAHLNQMLGLIEVISQTTDQPITGRGKW